MFVYKIENLINTIKYFKINNDLKRTIFYNIFMMPNFRRHQFYINHFIVHKFYLFIFIKKL